VAKDDFIVKPRFQPLIDQNREGRSEAENRTLMREIRAERLQVHTTTAERVKESISTAMQARSMLTSDPHCYAGLVRYTLVEIVTWWDEKMTPWFMQLYAPDATSMVMCKDR
jgi:hypothetical protein